MQGLEVDLQVFEDGEAAITLCAATLCQRCPRLSVVGVSGYEPAARQTAFEVLAVCETARDAGSIPVIVMTSSSALADRTSATALRADGYFVKAPSYDAFLNLGPLAEQMLGERR